MRWLLGSMTALLWFMGAAAVAQTAAVPQTPWSGPEIWFDPFTPAGSWMPAFQNETTWAKAAGQTSVLVLEPFFLTGSSDADIMTAIAFAKSHHMKLDLDVQSIMKTPGVACGGIEGYSYVTDIDPLVAILVRLGIRIDWIHLDEPLWFGHYDTEAGACQFDIDDLATNVVAIVNPVLAAYPGLEIVEIEPVPAVTSFPDWEHSMAQFQAELAQQTGKHVRAVQTDVDWSNPGWQSAISALNSFVLERNMGLGVIYNGLASDVGDAAWVNHAILNFDTLEGRLGIMPLQAIFASWAPNPTQMVPETMPASETGLIDSYMRERSRLEASFTGGGAQGRLTTWSGQPIVGATVGGYVPGVDFTKPLPVTVVTGTVPSNAATAILGFRLNTECSGCSGLDDVLIGTLQYQETQGGAVQYSWALSSNPANYGGLLVDGELVDGVRVTRVISAPGQGFTPNSPIFPVTAGATFQYTVPAATIGGAGWFGNVIIIWLDANGNGIGRVFVQPPAGEVTASTAVTAADGTFALPKLPRVGPGSVPVSVRFDGTATFRASTWVPLN